MFIPVTKAVGPAQVDIVADVSGTFTAACPFLYEGQGYLANSEIQVERTKTIRLTTEVSGYAEISVVLSDKQHYWFVDKPKTLRYVDDDAYKRITGSVAGQLLNTSTGESVPYIATQAFTGGDTVASIDFVKKKVWFFNTNSEVKVVTLSETPVAVLFVPRWSTVEGIVTVCYIVTQSSIIKMTDNLDIDETFPVEAGIVAASGDVKGMIVLAYDNRLVQWRDNVIEATIVQTGLLGIHSLFVAPDNTYVVGCNSGVMFVWNSEGQWESDTVTTYTGRYWAFDINALYLYAVDAFNRCLVKISLAERTYTAIYYDLIPRDVVVTDTDEVYVSFLNSATALRYDVELATGVEVPALKSFGAAYLDAYYVTNLYSDAADVTKLEPTVEPSVIEVNELARNEEFVYRWTVDWVRPEFVRVGNTSAVVRVNGNVFTSGYLRSGDSVAVYLPATDGYYDDRYVALIGRRDTVFAFRTVPKLFPDYVVVDSVLSAFLRITYEDMFEVTGMTWGFDVGITLNSVDVQFAVNDGEFGHTGRIKNGDIIHLVGSVKSLIAKRTAHQIVTQYDEPVAEWTLLPMLLDGTTKRTQATIKKDKFAHLFEANSSSLSPQQTPVTYPSITALSTETYAAPANQTTFSTVNVNGECSPALPCYAVEDTRFAVQPSAPSVTGEATFDTQSNAQTYGFDSTAHQGTQRTSYALNTELKSSGLMRVHIAEFQTDVDLRAQSNVDYFDATTGSVSLNTTYMVSSVCERRVFDVYDTVMEYVHRPIGYVAYADLDYLSGAGYTTSWSANGIENYTLSSIQYMDAVFNKVDSAVALEQQMNHFRFVAFHREQFVAGADAFWSYPISEFSAAADQRIQKNRHSVVTDAERRLLPTHWEFDSDPALRSLGVFVGISASYALRPSSDRYAIHIAYARTKSTTRHDIQTAFVQRTSNSRTVDAPQRVFVHSSRNSYTLSDVTSGFGTLEQAQAYAESINVAATATYLEKDGKWIFITQPIAENAACAVVTNPPTLQRRYGYAGGG